jgi:hypothetical protein
METDQMMAHLLAEIRTGQDHMKAKDGNQDGHAAIFRVKE